MFSDILDVINEELSLTYKDGVPDIIPALYAADRIFIAGAGRSKMVASMFAMRLVHCGYDVHVVGDATTPNLSKGDVFLVVSNSGETSQLVNFVVKAKTFGVDTILITGNSKSTMSCLCDTVVQIGHTTRSTNNVLPLGSGFELSALIFFESLILDIIKDNGLSNDDLQSLHANLE